MNEDVSKKKSEEGVEDEITQTVPEDDVDGAKSALEAKVKELEGKYLRTYADFENYRKRVAKEKEEVRQATSEHLLRELLDVKDHLELALSHSNETQASPEFKTLRDGVQLTLKHLQHFLKKCGVEEVRALGEPFNPAFHEAIQQEESLEYAPGSVVRVYQKGYLLNGRLLRAARVTVASASSKEKT
ncbi:MAG TPA: nucleotide exchange factor GrpE [bacterium]|nr:nucleotide exchange factor GrpE [bacterium]